MLINMIMSVRLSVCLSRRRAISTKEGVRLGGFHQTVVQRVDQRCKKNAP